jgi:polyphosphate kinase
MLYIDGRMTRQLNVRVADDEYKALVEISRFHERKVSQTIRLFIKRYMPLELARLREQQEAESRQGVSV